MSAAPAVPLCVDCDGTLIRTDLLHESVFALLKASCFKLLLLPLWLLTGKSFLKERLSGLVTIDASTLPYNEPLVTWLREQRSLGREIVLATAAHERNAQAVAEHLGVFDRVVATQDGGVNVAGAEKARQLSELYGSGGFDYVGDSTADLPVWDQAHGAIVVNGSSSLLARAARATRVLRSFDAPSASLIDYVKALRLHQWLKNVLILVPALAAHRLSEFATLWTCALAFLSFSLCASSVYVLNDLLDLPSDRRHARKRHRPFAAGRLPIWQGALLIPGLLLLSAAIASQLNGAFQLVLAMYLVVTMAYSVRLKNHPIVDVIVLACLYTLRVIAGAAATQIAPSFWLLAFSLFLFLSLALVKRYSELLVVLARSEDSAAGRGYNVGDLSLLMSLGVAAGMSACLVLALYVKSPEVALIYPSPQLLWAMVPLLLHWICRIWMKAHRGVMHDDPVVFAARDRQSQLVAALGGLILMAAGQVLF